MIKLRKSWLWLLVLVAIFLLAQRSIGTLDAFIVTVLPATGGYLFSLLSR